MEKTLSSNENKSWYDKYYKLLFIIPILLTFLSFFYLINFYQKYNDIMLRDTSLSGGTTITLKAQKEIDYKFLESSLKKEFSNLNIKKLTDLRTGETTAYIIESSEEQQKLKSGVEKILGYNLTEKNSNIEFTGSSLSKSFYKQLVIALVIAFILISVVVFFLFKTIIPSIAVILSIFLDVLMPLALVDYIGLRVSAAGIAAFLMLIGYSVDTDILLTSRVLKKKEGSVNERIFGAFKTGIFMTTTALLAVIPGLSSDIVNTWLTNASLIKWYCEKKKIE